MTNWNKPKLKLTNQLQSVKHQRYQINLKDYILTVTTQHFENLLQILETFFQLVDAAGELLASVLIRAVGIQVERNSKHHHHRSCFPPVRI